MKTVIATDAIISEFTETDSGLLRSVPSVEGTPRSLEVDRQVDSIATDISAASTVASDSEATTIDLALVRSFLTQSLLPNSQQVASEAAIAEDFETLAAAPNDPFFSSQFALDVIGAQEAYEILTPLPGSAEPIVVAVIDTGIDYTHPDLAPNVFTNDLEANGTPGVDDDGNGFVDDIFGYDFVDNDGDPFDENFHGTAVAGVIGADSNNGFGIAGVADPFNVELLGVRALGADGSGTLDDVAAAVVYAVDTGADVINLSLGGGGFSLSLFDALAYADANDVLVVAAAGNAGQDNDLLPTFPASFGFDNIISVAATTSSNDLASFSNFGATSVDLGAPGANIVTTVPDGQFASISGTSFSSPLVAGVAAALLASLPASVANPTDTVIDLLLDTVAPDADLQGNTVTGGILDFAAAAQALIESFPTNSAPVAVDDAVVLAEDSSIAIAPLSNDSDADGDTLTIVSFTEAGNGTLSLNADGTFTYTPDANFNGSDSFTYTITDGNGETATGTISLTVTAVNDGPTAVGDTVQAQANTPLTIAVADLLANDSDIDGDTLAVVGVGNFSGGSAQLNQSGDITFTPASGFAGAASFDYTVADGQGGTATATATVTVAPAPAAASAATGDNFDAGIDASFFAEVGNGTVNDNFGGSGNSLFFTGGSRNDGSRFATTQALDVSDGGTIAFDLVFGTSQNGGENADAGEDVSLSYSIDGGNTFVEFARYDTEAFTSFTNITEVIPTAARTSETQFRFQQVAHSGSNFDNFALDNVEVLGADAVVAPAIADPVTGFSEDFDPGIDASLFAEVSNGTANDNFGGSGNSLFFTGGSRNDGSRFATTQALDVSDGGTIAFDLVFGTSQNGGENADAGEDVSLSYSIDGGNTFVEFARYDTEAFTSFTNITEVIPTAARTSETQFRFQQVAHSGSSFDNFALDNIEIAIA